MKRVSIALVTFAGFLVCSEMAAQPSAQSAPTTVQFVVEDGVPITVAGETGPGDVVLFIGKPIGVMQVGNCVLPDAQSNFYPVQNIIVVNPGTGRPTFTTAVQTSSTTELKPGTRLSNVIQTGTCGIGATAYQKYEGTVE